MMAHQRRFVITMKNVDEVGDGEHACSHESTKHPIKNNNKQTVIKLKTSLLEKTDQNRFCSTSFMQFQPRNKYLELPSEK